MDNNFLASVAGILLSLGFAYLPGVKEKFEVLTSQGKALTMAGLLLVAALVVFGLSCWSPYEYITCDQTGAWGLAKLFVAALIANQGMYLLAVRPFKS